MATVKANNGTPAQNQGLIDLVQGAIAYEAFVKAFGAGKSAQDAVTAANQAIANMIMGNNRIEDRPSDAILVRTSRILRRSGPQ